MNNIKATPHLTGHGPEWKDANLTPEEARAATAWVEAKIDRATLTGKDNVEDVRDLRGRVAIHAACAVVVNNELYAARIGKGHVFLVRHARLFLPGDDGALAQRLRLALRLGHDALTGFLRGGFRGELLPALRRRS